jgi:hypothetical protein
LEHTEGWRQINHCHHKRALSIFFVLPSPGMMPLSAESINIWLSTLTFRGCQTLYEQERVALLDAPVYLNEDT